ncbi:MAG: hypothetical protein IPO64_15630 [Bacteroidetes bacterium]|nr:hypothetical protein [Bacteroidota bacterium]
MKDKNNQTFIWKDHIRKRPGMYLGELGLTGFKNMLRYLLEEILNDCFENPVLEISFLQNNEITLKIININTQKFLQRLADLKNTNIEWYNLGLGVLIALSYNFKIGINDLQSYVVGHRGDFKMASKVPNDEGNIVLISFSIDKEIFKNFEFDYELINSFFISICYIKS